MKRRNVLIGGVAGLTAAAGYTGYRYAPPFPVHSSRSPRAIAQELVNTLNGDQANNLVADWNSPFRQYHNRGVWAGGELIANAGFDRHQLSLNSELFYAGLSEQGREIVPKQYFSLVANIMIHNLQLIGDPASENFLVIFSGPHLNMRISDSNASGYAFSGPQIYGDQRGNGEAGLPDNKYLPQLTLGMKIFDGLSEGQQADALLETSPIQTRIELETLAEGQRGISVSTLSTAARQDISQCIDLILSPYANNEYAKRCIADNGGLDSLSISWYADSQYKEGDPFQTFRIEGPTSVLYFRGYPHVHAFFNIGMARTSFSSGEVVFDNAALIEGEALRQLLEASMREAEQTDFAHYNLDGVVGRLYPGTVRTGDIYNAESWQSEVVVVSARGRDINGKLADRLEEDKVSLAPDQRYTIATIGFVADNILEDEIGTATEVRRSGLLRDQMISYCQTKYA